MYQHTRFVKEWVKKKIKNSTAAKIFHNQNNNPAPSKNKKKMENWYNKYNNVKKTQKTLKMIFHINGIISICLMLKSISLEYLELQSALCEEK